MIDDGRFLLGIVIVIFVAALSFFMFAVLSDMHLDYLYSTTILCEESEVPAAISNAVAKVLQKGLVVTTLYTSRNIFTKSYYIKVQGSEYDNEGKK